MRKILPAILFIVTCVVYACGQQQNMRRYMGEDYNKPDSSKFGLVWSPTLFFMAQFESFAQYKIYHGVTLMGGGGLNIDIYNPNAPSYYNSSGIGFTLRLGIMLPTGPRENNYIAFMGFYRHWSLQNVDSYSASGFFGDFNDGILNPDGFLTGGNYNTPANVYIYNAQVDMGCFDIEDIIRVFRYNGLIMEIYAGYGYRTKNIMLTYTGYYSGGTSQTFIPDTQHDIPSQFQGVRDVKLGILMGFEL